VHSLILRDPDLLLDRSSNVSLNLNSKLPNSVLKASGFINDGLDLVPLRFQVVALAVWPCSEVECGPGGCQLPGNP
jgi:hypothetical protein